MVDPTLGASAGMDEGAGMNPTPYWPWWVGALTLGSVTVLFTLLVDRPLGVSGSWDRVVHWRRERRRELQDEQFGDPELIAAALAEAMAGVAAPSPMSSESMVSAPMASEPMPSEPVTPEHGPERASSERSARVADRSRRPVPLVAEAVFLIAMFLGGLLAAKVSGRFELRSDMGPDCARLVTANPALMYGALLVGGVMVGFGTRLGGGCSSGHGLSGCSRLHPASLVATAVFFGSAAVMSTLLWKVI